MKKEKLTPNMIPKDDSHAIKMGIISKINGKYELTGLNKDKSLKMVIKKLH